MMFEVPTDVRHVAIPEVEVPGKRLGRHVWHDQRSKDFPADTATRLRDVLHEALGLPLDQADVSSCTAEALCAARNADPDRGQNAPLTQDDAYALYHDETILERQPWPPNDPGGSGLMVCRAAKRRGWISSYRHAFGIDHALHALVLRPVIFGVAWFDSFDTPDANGVVGLTPRARVRGGHEICAVEIRASAELVGFWNSWGAGYGKGGRFWMAMSTLDKLLREGGDATVPIV